MKCIMEIDYSKRDWTELIKKVEEEISEMYPWDVMSRYVEIMDRIMNIEDEVFASVVEAGSFRLDMRYGELRWEFFMPRTSSAVTSCRKEITFLWDEFVPGEAISYVKEIAIPYRDCGIEGFVSVVKAEMGEVMARKLANDLLETSKEEV